MFFIFRTLLNRCEQYLDDIKYYAPYSLSQIKNFIHDLSDYFTTHGLSWFRSRRQNCSRGVSGRPSLGNGGKTARDLNGGIFFTAAMHSAL